MSCITKENTGSCTEFSYCEESKLSPRNKIGGRGAVIKLGLVVGEIEFSFCMSEPYSVNADLAMLVINNNVNDNGNNSS